MMLGKAACVHFSWRLDAASTLHTIYVMMCPRHMQGISSLIDTGLKYETTWCHLFLPSPIIERAIFSPIMWQISSDGVSM